MIVRYNRAASCPIDKITIRASTLASISTATMVNKFANKNMLCEKTYIRKKLPNCKNEMMILKTTVEKQNKDSTKRV